MILTSNSSNDYNNKNKLLYCMMAKSISLNVL